MVTRGDVPRGPLRPLSVSLRGPAACATRLATSPAPRRVLLARFPADRPRAGFRLRTRRARLDDPLTLAGQRARAGGTPRARVVPRDREHIIAGPSHAPGPRRPPPRRAPAPPRLPRHPPRLSLQHRSAHRPSPSSTAAPAAPSPPSSRSLPARDQASSPPSRHRRQQGQAAAILETTTARPLQESQGLRDRGLNCWTSRRYQTPCGPTKSWW